MFRPTGLFEWVILSNGKEVGRMFWNEEKTPKEILEIWLEYVGSTNLGSNRLSGVSSNSLNAVLVD